MVPGQQPLPQCEQDKGADCGLQEKEGQTRLHSHQWAGVERVESLKFLGVHITSKLSWSKHTKTVVKRARQHLFSLRKRFGKGPQMLKKLYSCTIEGITSWYGNSSASDRKVLQKSVRTAQYIIIIGAKLPDIKDLYTRRCQRKAQSHRLFFLLPHVKRYRSAKSRSKRLLNSFNPQTIRLLNN